MTYRASVADGQVAVRFEQMSQGVFDIPVTVTLVHANGATTDVVLTLSDRIVERTIPTESRVRDVQVNRDSAALAEFDER